MLCDATVRVIADYEDSLPVLWDPSLRINYPMRDYIAQFILESVPDHAEGTPAIMPLKILYVLEQKGARPLLLEDANDIEEERSLCLIEKAVGAAEAVLLGDAREAEGLAGKAAAEDVELGDVGHGHGMDVAVRGLAEVGGVGLAAELVPVAGEDAASARPLKGDAKSADAAEEVDEA